MLKYIELKPDILFVHQVKFASANVKYFIDLVPTCFVPLESKIFNIYCNLVCIHGSDERIISLFKELRDSIHQSTLFNVILAHKKELVSSVVKYVLNFHLACCSACKRGDYESFQLLKKHNVPPSNFYVSHDMFVFACEGGNLNLVKYLESCMVLGSTVTDQAIFNGACRSGNMKIIEHISKDLCWILLDLDEALSSAARGAHLDVIKFLIGKGARNLNGALLYAARSGDMETIGFLIESGATNISGAFLRACFTNKIEAMKFLCETGDVSYQLGMPMCSTIEAAQFLMKYGAVPDVDCILNAIYSYDLDLLSFHVDKINDKKLMIELLEKEVYHWTKRSDWQVIEDSISVLGYKLNLRE
ncbi:ankyrin repeat-containing protein [Acrasis kona]|uniref:Ankyrin repeat-containing protein n=1 Tax=Acrasis kona TaxID=1008807 RepID=A0AAW2ZK87_9EUKA